MAHNGGMLRDPNLVPLSRQHQHALALCVRLDRALQSGDVDLEAWQAEIQQLFEQEIAIHFAAEEKVVFRAAACFPDMRLLAEELAGEHALLRGLCLRAAERTLNKPDLCCLAETLSAHIRKEERQLFEGMQKRMTPDELATLGTGLDEALADASQACILPSEATKLRPKA
jgi:hemerythrin-like domain-containing protein